MTTANLTITVPNHFVFTVSALDDLYLCVKPFPYARITRTNELLDLFLEWLINPPINYTDKTTSKDIHPVVFLYHSLLWGWL